MFEALFFEEVLKKGPKYVGDAIGITITPNGFLDFDALCTGEGSWRQWKYQVRIVDNNVSYENITGTEFIIQNLRPSAFYSIQVAASSDAGRGPWSTPLRGKTLHETPYNITFLWGTQSGLYTTNTLGENVELLASPTVWMNNGSSSFAENKFVAQSSPSPPSQLPVMSNIYMSSLTWFESLVFFALSNGSVYYYDTVSNYPSSMSQEGPSSNSRNVITKLTGVPNAQSIAFDYIGQKLYWSNPKQQTILRCSFIKGSVGNRNNLAVNVETVNPCSQREKAERLQVITMAREIAVDSYKGLLLWSTGHSLELSRLNGYSHRTLHQTGLFSGIHIMGITLDTDQSRVYWISRSATGSTLQRFNYNIRGAQLPMIIANYDDTSITGPIRYFNERLIWLQGPSEAVITDLFGQGKSSLTVSTISNITNLHVRDQSSQRYPGGLTRNKIQVYPDPILKWTISLQGKWNNFTVSWHPVNNTNYGKILYEVVVNNSISKITNNSNMTIENGTAFKPYTDLEITITSLTYWASSKPVTARLKTPSWRPSEPLNPRVFVQKLDYPYAPSRMVTNLSTGSNSVSVELRWDVPTNTNGLILGYLIHCWKDTMKKADCMCEVDMSKLQHPSCQIQHLAPNSKYYFAIQAYTDTGAGNLSTKVLADTSYNTPVPRLMLVSAEKLQILDIDRNDMEPIPLGYLSPLTATHFESEDTVFWFNEGQDLLWSKLGSTNKSRILSLSGQAEASNIVVDWIGRKLYWTFEEISSASAVTEEKYGIMMVDLVPNWNLPQSPKVVVGSKTPIRSVTVNPFRKSLYWTTSRRNGITTLFTSEIDGSSPRPFLSRDPVTCNCSSLSSTGEPVAFDPHGLGLGSGFPSGILFVDKQAIWLSDDNGCNCIHLVNFSTLPFLQNSPYRIAADQHRVYWAGGFLYASEKMGNGGATELQPIGAGVREVSVFGPVSQPFPDLTCLIPQRMEPREPLLFNHSSHSLHLQLPQPVTDNCSLTDVSLPTPRYNVYYGTVDENGISECTPTSSSFCKVVTTLENMLHITDLHPYTTYTVFVTLTNYYAEQQGDKPLGCSPIMLRTAPGAPMPPTLLRLEPLTPTSIRVVWRQPEKLNGEKVWYEVHWKTSGARSSPKHNGQRWAETETRSNHNRTEYYLDLKDLLPERNYTIWVVAYSEKGDAFSESERHYLETFVHPNNITLVKASPHNLSIAWVAPNDTSILRHQIMYRDGWSAQWNFTELVDFTIPQRVYKINITNLKPKTLYGFRIQTWYIGDPKATFIWPSEGQFNFETLADKPGKPGKPIPRGIGNAIYEITWEKAEENGAEIEMYSLECKIEFDTSSPADAAEIGNQSLALDLLSNVTSNAGNSTTNISRHKRDLEETGKVEAAAEKLISSSDSDLQRNSYIQWDVVYNGTDARWQVDGLDVNKKESQGFGIVLGSIFLACLTLGTCAFLTLFLYRGKLKEKPILNGTISSSERRELELATLRELPGGSTFIHQSNILYAADLLVDMDFTGISKISRHQISITKFLGSGAFGEVYEGIASGLLGPHEDTRVAIKVKLKNKSFNTLRKGASNVEKMEFIQEAKLMVQFQHPHIIQLLGICVDTDPCFLLLELMSGGDLLSYLRSHRPNLGSSTSLTIIDLLKMCVDVAKGCVYLEEKHFVHRDLAARNCLVQLEAMGEDGQGSRSGSNGECRRVVKIGDFGLARDIYRNDYYRKEGEGLLPVRWMAPESLVDGVFTTQSDVWAFGITAWEIMTLGQQPYPARNNLEVLHYVRGGGRLHQPLHCPQSLSQLMLRCWEYNPGNRPTFRECQTELEDILRAYQSVQIGDQPSTSGSPDGTNPPCKLGQIFKLRKFII
ncbi:Proto-oncogene tyrosine-protein kinase ROS [Orchesella cincta]|uniref:Tyrosine-protein kinase receptor n=1 Tax=Orchesella cincta TaxID=48709 RepID=A0A1D2MSC0_ORCCI|nr:Proto-oncogene tyrosine-protein kinase ROS [Orchesella cincta]